MSGQGQYSRRRDRVQRGGQLEPFSISAFSPVAPIPFGPGGGAVVTLTRSGHVYVAPQIGFGLAGPSGALPAGALDHPQGAANGACRNAQVDKFISGWGATINASSPVVGPVGVSLAKTAGFPGKATEAGVGIQPDLSVRAPRRIDHALDAAARV